MPGVDQREFLARLARRASAEPALPARWRRDGGWLHAPSGAPQLSLGFAVRRHDAGTYVHMVRDARTEPLIAQLQGERSVIEDAFGGPLNWGAPRGDRRYQIYATLDRAGYASERRRWVASIDELVSTMVRLCAAVHAGAAIDDEGELIATTSLARRLSGPERRAVEERAMDVAASELRRAGWNRVVRTAERQAWDYEVGDGRQTARVEVKGSTAPIRRIDLTRNERDSAMGHPHSILVLVSQIELDADGPRAHGGPRTSHGPLDAC